MDRRPVAHARRRGVLPVIWAAPRCPRTSSRLWRRVRGTLNRRNTFAVYYQLHHAKRPETRARRIEKFISMFERGETLH
jgi:hypothetical protein